MSGLNATICNIVKEGRREVRSYLVSDVERDEGEGMYWKVRRQYEEGAEGRRQRVRWVGQKKGKETYRRPRRDLEEHVTYSRVVRRMKDRR